MNFSNSTLIMWALKMTLQTSLIKNLPANAGGMGSIPGLGLS